MYKDFMNKSGDGLILKSRMSTCEHAPYIAEYLWIAILIQSETSQISYSLT